MGLPTQPRHSHKAAKNNDGSDKIHRLSQCIFDWQPRLLSWELAQLSTKLEKKNTIHISKY